MTDPKSSETLVGEELSGGSTEQEMSSSLNLASKNVEEDKSRRVYVGNLNWRVNWQDLKDHMRAAGEVTRADIMTGSDGRSKGCGIVEYSSAEEAQKAVLTLNDTELNGRPIFVREDREERGSRASNRFSSDASAQSRRVYVGNLSWDVAWQDLKDHMVRLFIHLILLPLT
jgi:RNA recognition motif-containing protein